MKYYIINNEGTTTEVSKSVYYGWVKKSPFMQTIHTNNGKKVARSIRVNK